MVFVCGDLIASCENPLARIYTNKNDVHYVVYPLISRTRLHLNKQAQVKETEASVTTETRFINRMQKGHTGSEVAVFSCWQRRVKVRVQRCVSPIEDGAFAKFLEHR